jgi:hypothetical protein
VEIDHREHGVLRHASGNAGLDRIKIDAGKLIEKSRTWFNQTNAR